MLRFNSTTVQLIHNVNQPSSLVAYLFQFHNGTINTLLLCSQLLYSRMFQFHNGTINTEYRSEAEICLSVSIPQRYN